MRSSAVLFAALLLMASGVLAPLTAGAQHGLISTGSQGPAAGPAPQIENVENATNYLAIPDEDDPRSGFAGPGLDAGAAVAADAGSLSTEHARITFEQSFDEASSNSERSELIRTYASRLEQRRELLQRQDRAVIESYANGTTSAQTMARERARIHAEAEALQAYTVWIKGVSSEPRDYSLSSTPLDDRLENVRWEFEVFQGPVSDRMNQFARGSAFGQTMYAESSNSGYTIATVNDTTYMRETYLPDERAEDSVDQFSQPGQSTLDATDERITELYPWAWSNFADVRNIKVFGEIGIYRYTIGVPGGELTTHLDGGSENVFREYQRLRPSSVPVSETVTRTNGTLQVTINRTYETGPMEVSLSRDTTGVAATGNVTIDGQHVGSTGTDGSTWIVEPRRPYTLNATAESGGNVSVAMS